MSGTLDTIAVERRILRACKTIRVMPDREKSWFNPQQGMWAQVVQDFTESGHEERQARPRFRPTPADISDVLTALSWARALTREEFELIWARSFDVSFRTIGMRYGVSDETARRYFIDAVLRCWQAANEAGGYVPQKNCA